MPSNRTPFNVGDRVHVPLLGTGIVLEVRTGGRYLVEVKGRSLLVTGAQIERAEPARKGRGRTPTVAQAATMDAATASKAPQVVRCVDLHGKTALEAIEALDEFINDAVLDGADELRIIHGQSGATLKMAVHARLAQLRSIRAFRLDRHNAGVTIAVL